METSRASAASPSSAQKVESGWRSIAATTIRAFLVALALVTVPFGCWEWTPAFCADGYVHEFRNTTSNDCIVTPYTRTELEPIKLLVVHGFQRGRFGLPAGSSRELLLETGDDPFVGAVLECDGDPTRRVITGEALPKWTWRPVISVLDSKLYPAAPADAVELSSFMAVWTPPIVEYFSYVIPVCMPVTLTAFIVARGRSRRRPFDVAR